ncbi:hypothetical protein PHYSODRAFT_512287, partial [Phytophthora sojae]
SNQFKTWTTYIDMLNKKYPGNTVTMAGVISAKYGDEALAKMIEPAMHVPSQQRLAANLVLQQRNNWEAAVKSVDDVFTLLRLDKAGDDLFKTSQINRWYNYVSYLKRLNGGVDEEAAMVKTFTKFYGNEALSKMLEAAKKVSTTETMATKLQTAQFKMWLKNRVKPMHIWSMLKMEKATWMANPSAEVWRGYNAFYKLNKPQ